jgi:hypothetical protein
MCSFSVVRIDFRDTEVAASTAVRVVQTESWFSSPWTPILRPEGRAEAEAVETRIFFDAVKVRAGVLDDGTLFYLVV